MAKTRQLPKLASVGRGLAILLASLPVLWLSASEPAERQVLAPMTDLPIY